MDFGDLGDDQPIQTKLTNLHDSIKKIETFIELALTNTEIYEKLSTKEQVDYDLFIAYAFNTLYWVYLRTRGEDPNNNDIKNQLNRIKTQMLKAKEADDRNTIRPRVNQQAAERFIKHGISHKRIDKNEPPKKKIKFS